MPKKSTNYRKYHSLIGSAPAVLPFCVLFCPSTAFFVDKAPAYYYNSVVKMAFLCGFVAARKKYS